MHYHIIYYLSKKKHLKNMKKQFENNSSFNFNSITRE